MTDRFPEVKHHFEHGWMNGMRRLADVAWLIGEVEALRAERAQYIADAATALTQLRDEVQS
jgi:hypothetical protein